MKTKPILVTLLVLGVTTLLSSFASAPFKAKPVGNFDLNKYLGTWYEIARLDFYFERGLENVTAQYSIDADGDVRVLNKGYNVKKKKWVSSKGIAKFKDDKHTAALKVSFFRPFYGAYNVIALDPDYKYALVTGSDFDYLWILSREKTIPQNIRTKYVKFAQEMGYDTSKLIWVKQDHSRK